MSIVFLYIDECTLLTNKGYDVKEIYKLDISNYPTCLYYTA